MKPTKLLISALLVALLPAAALAEEAAALSWAAYRQLRDVRGVFCHPTDPLVAWAATSSGLVRTEDEGRNWQPVPAASHEKVGLVTNLVCCPADENRLLMGTDEKGLFLSADGGKTFGKLGAADERLASDHIEHVSFGDSDPSWRTLFVTHGRAAAGMSISRDLGKTWEVFARDRFLRSFVKDGDTIVAAGSMVETDGEVWGIHRSGWDGQRWEECNRGIRPGQAALPILHPLRFMFSTLDGGVLESNNDGRTWYPVATMESASWESLFFTFGATGGSEILVAYDPYDQGVVLSDRRFRPGSHASRKEGLYVGPFVKSGAKCRANANGSVFYVVLNDSLWIGRRVAPKTGPTVAQTRCLPATMWVQTHVTSGAEADLHRRIAAAAAGSPGEADVKGIAQAHQTFNKLKGAMSFVVQGRVEHPNGPKAVKAVTVDLSILGRSRSSVMFDDGKHADGKPADGLWALEVPFLPADFDKPAQGDRRRRLPGISALTVTAFDTGGASGHWSAVLGIFRRPEPVSIWPGGRHFRFSSTGSEGPVRVYEAGRQGPSQSDAVCFEATGPGPWNGHWIMGAGGLNITGCDAVTFYVKGDVPQELNVHVVDRYVVGIDAIDVPHYSRAVPLIQGGYLKAIRPDYQHVRVPLAELLPRGTVFLRRHGAGFALSVDQAGKAGTYYIADFQAVP